MGRGSSPQPRYSAVRAGLARRVHRHPSAPGVGVLWALAFPRSTAQSKSQGACVVLRPSGGRLGPENWGWVPLCCDFKSPGFVSPGVLDCWRHKGGNQGWAGQACGRGLGAWPDPLGLTKPVPQAFRLEPWAAGSRPNLSSRAGVASVALQAVL